ncbi:MAG: tRNA methyltransferase [Metallosphaera sp.]|nr:tRNA methyltransferase [Metallosphaera cuprina]
MYIEGDDLKVVDKIRSTIGKWGGNYFTIDITSEPKKIVSEWKKDGGKVVHLTMYGINVPEIIDNIRQLDNILVIVGAEKVEGWYYHIADFNVAISNQPHSEVASLAIFLDRLYKGEQLNLIFGDSKISVIPTNGGKRVIHK